MVRLEVGRLVVWILLLVSMNVRVHDLVRVDIILPLKELAESYVVGKTVKVMVLSYSPGRCDGVRWPLCLASLLWCADAVEYRWRRS